jgi:hypothetical protein
MKIFRVKIKGGAFDDYTLEEAVRITGINSLQGASLSLEYQQNGVCIMYASDGSIFTKKVIAYYPNDAIVSARLVEE